MKPYLMLNFTNEEAHIKRLKTELARSREKVRRLKAELAQSEQGFRTVAENAPDSICRFDRNCRHLYVNPATSRSTGAPASAFMGKTPHEAGLPGPFADLWVGTIDKVLKTARSTTLEFSFPSPGGEKYFQALLTPEYNPEGSWIESVLSITRDITEMKQAQKQKDDFLGIVSHELKTPVTSLKAFVQLIQSKLEKDGDYTHASHLSNMDHQLDRLTSLINDLLDLTKIQEGKLQFKETVFDFDRLVKEAIEQMQQTSRTHKIVLQGTTGKQLLADEDRIRQVLINLLSNAIKYSPKAKKILVTLEPKQNQVICGVRDFGVGIPRTQQAQIFERFFRADHSQSYPGLGLGLYISKEILKLQGGRIWLESGLRKGSLFCFSLPVNRFSGQAA